MVKQPAEPSLPAPEPAAKLAHPANAAIAATGESAVRMQVLSALQQAILRSSPWLPWVLIVLPVLLGFLYVHAFGFNIVWEDQGNGELPMFQKWFAGNLTFIDLWRPHGAHRIFFPRLIMLGLGLMTSWNTVAEMYFTEVMLVIYLGVNLYALRRSLPATSSPWWLVPVAWIVFTWRQHQNMLFGFQVTFVLVTVAASAAMFILSTMSAPRQQGWKFAAAVSAATVSSFSSAHGLMVWPAGAVIPLLFESRSRKARFLLTGAWVAAGAIEWLIYFLGFVVPTDRSSYSVEYTVTLVGGALFSVLPLATVAGFVILSLVAVAAFLAAEDGKWSAYGYWMAIIAFGLLTAAQVMLGRSAFGTAQALASRYATASSLILLGVYGTLCRQLAGKRSPAIAACWGFFFCLLSLGTLVSLLEGYAAGEQMNKAMNYQAFIFLTFESQPDQVVQQGAGPPAAAWRDGLKDLKEHRWNLFSSPDLLARYTPPTGATTLSTAARLGGNQLLGFDKQTGVLTAAGWATDPEGAHPVGGVFLELDGVIYPTLYGVAREDAVAALKNDRVRESGFWRVFPPSLVGPGRHRLVIHPVTEDRKAWYAPSQPMEFTTSP
jgi:hypothetical protein